MSGNQNLTPGDQMANQIQHLISQGQAHIVINGVTITTHHRVVNLLLSKGAMCGRKEGSTCLYSNQCVLVDTGQNEELANEECRP